MSYAGAITSAVRDRHGMRSECGGVAWQVVGCWVLLPRVLVLVCVWEGERVTEKSGERKAEKESRNGQKGRKTSKGKEKTETTEKTENG